LPRRGRCLLPHFVTVYPGRVLQTALGGSAFKTIAGGTLEGQVVHERPDVVGEGREGELVRGAEGARFSVAAAVQ
jgi:hypothetical protein